MHAREWIQSRNIAKLRTMQVPTNERRRARSPSDAGDLADSSSPLSLNTA